MSSYSSAMLVSRFESVIDDLPDEVLEYILSLVPPYKDLHNCSLVCKRWQRSVKNVIRHAQKSLLRAVSEFNIMWEDVTPTDSGPTITKRYSHSACRYGNSMYVFGGCTSTSTTFNDLWRLDLNKRQWERPLTMGSYPSPKACASIVCYGDTLVLFGGWTHPSPYPLHQAWRLFNELHMYSIVSNRWSSITCTTFPPAMAGHSCTVHGGVMVVFGGLQKFYCIGQYSSSNDVWLFNLESHTWIKQVTTDNKPHPRYGQSQIALDDDHILILGGCGGPNMVFSDVWLLSMIGPTWMWQEVQVHNVQFAPAHMWCHPACKIGSRVVVFSRSPVSNAPALPYRAQWNAASQLRGHPVPQDDDTSNRRLQRSVSQPAESDISGRQGTSGMRHAVSSATTSSSSGDESEPESGGVNTLHRRIAIHSMMSDPSGAHSSESLAGLRSYSFNEVDNRDFPSGGIGGMAAFRDNVPSPRGSSNRNRQRQLESLKRMEERLRSLSRSSEPPRAEASSCSSSSGPSSSSAPASPTPNPSPRHSVPKNAMAMFVLDISNVLTEECFVEWLPIKSDNIALGGPEEMILYSLIAGKGELIMFGGIQKDATSITAQAQISSPSVTNTVSNSLYFISPPKGII